MNMSAAAVEWLLLCGNAHCAYTHYRGVSGGSGIVLSRMQHTQGHRDDTVTRGVAGPMEWVACRAGVVWARERTSRAQYRAREGLATRSRRGACCAQNGMGLPDSAPSIRIVGRGLMPPPRAGGHVVWERTLARACYNAVSYGCGVTPWHSSSSTLYAE